MDTDALIEEITTKAQLGNIESQLVAEEIMRIPHDELERFAHDLFFDTDDVIPFRLDCKAVKHYAEQAIARKYNETATRICNQLLALRKENVTEKNKLMMGDIVLFEGEELVDLVKNGFQHSSIVRKISARLGGQNAALQRL